jgi:hypothetical protein
MKPKRIGSGVIALGLTLMLLGARIFAVPALSDPLSAAVPPSFHLHAPWLYLLLAPLFTLWDGASILSMTRLKGLLVGLVTGYLLWRGLRLAMGGGFSWLREARALVLSLCLLIAFLVAGAVWHRPMLSLAGSAPDEVVTDFHSHTNVSQDVRNTWMKGFDAEANRRWHRRAGFDAVFITDHNTVDGLGTQHRRAAPVLCPGIEVSAWRSHIVLLGDSVLVDRTRYNGSLSALLSLLRTSDSAYGALSVASLPEYRRNHWGRLDTLIAAGLDGFEVVNASPKANELSQAERDSVIALARSHNRFVVGASDSHGWGATSMAWNLVKVPVADRQNDICAALLHRLADGFSAVRVIERHRLRPEAWWPMWLTPVGVVWETWRSMGWALTGAWLVWIWAWASWPILLRTARRRVKIASHAGSSLEGQ